jgi:hypothetical protein
MDKSISEIKWNIFILCYRFDIESCLPWIIVKI